MWENWTNGGQKKKCHVCERYVLNAGNKSSEDLTQDLRDASGPKVHLLFSLQCLQPITVEAFTWFRAAFQPVVQDFVINDGILYCISVYVCARFNNSIPPFLAKYEEMKGDTRLL